MVCPFLLALFQHRTLNIPYGASQGGLERIQATLKSSVKKGVLSQDAAAAAASRLSGTVSYDNFKGVDLVIEAAVEVPSSCVYNHV